MANRQWMMIAGAGASVLVLVGAVTLASRHKAPQAVTVPVHTAHHAKRHAPAASSHAAPAPTDAPLMLPVSGKIQEKFGWQFSGALNEWYYNPGVTIAAPVHHTVKAAWGGTVTNVANQQPSGLTVSIKDGDGYSTVYSHLGTATVKVGQTVQQGQVIGTVGGNDVYSHQPGSHVDFDVYHGTMAVDPLRFLHASS
ncbi:MAG: M23 family metallopeptidase [Firmicutes bacterium]|nr:M23 family metallopeptidase [Bacillota bacterium]